MTKLHVADTVEDALNQAVALVGIDAIAAAIGKSPSMVRKMADPDDDARHLYLRDALTVDRLLAREGHQQVFAELLARRSVGNVEIFGSAGGELATASPLSQAIRLMGHAADLVEGIQAAESDGLVDGKELNQLLDLLNRIARGAAPARRALQLARAQRGAGGVSASRSEARLRTRQKGHWR